MNYFNRIYHPILFQGEGKSRGYFEGWYFKLVDKNGKRPLAIIPGISFSLNKEDAHAFIQILDGGTGQSIYYRFPRAVFRSEKNPFAITLGQNRFSLSGLTLDLNDQNVEIKGSVNFGATNPWPITLFSPGAMGPFAFLPGLECYHGVLSFDHPLSGELIINGDKIDFSGGRGYIEKDWGSSMPQAWVWMQSNTFEVAGASLSVSIARVPWMGFSFVGFIIGFLCEGKQYRFATYTGAKLKNLKVSGGKVSFEVADGNFRLTVEATGEKEGAFLAAPVIGSMTGRIKESLRAVVKATLFRKTDKGWFEFFSGTGRCAGLEIVGNL
jgi:hypothetical protein